MDYRTWMLLIMNVETGNLDAGRVVTPFKNGLSNYDVLNSTYMYKITHVYLQKYASNTNICKSYKSFNIQNDLQCTKVDVLYIKLHIRNYNGFLLIFTILGIMWKFCIE